MFKGGIDRFVFSWLARQIFRFWCCRAVVSVVQINVFSLKVGRIFLHIG